MVFIQEPLRQLRQPLRPRPHKKMTLSATDDFWNAPFLELEDAMPSDDAAASDVAASSAAASVPTDQTDGDDGVDDGDDDDFFEVIELPAAHEQLLSDDPATSEDLKGYDHTEDVFDEDGDDYASDKASYAPKGQGSWLADLLPPGLVRVPSADSLESDECSASNESGGDGCNDDLSGGSGKRGGVSFDTVVKVQPIPHSDTLTPTQRKEMYTTSWEVRLNKTRNKKEFKYEGYNWRDAKEEWQMAVDMVTGDLVHPAHLKRIWPPA